MLSRRNAKRQLAQSSKRNEVLNYEALETRNLLATIVGTEQADSVQLHHVSTDVVDITINGETQSSVDISEGLLVNMLGGLDDIFIDHRITANITLAHVEDLTIDGSELNQWQIGAFENDVPGLEAYSAGNVNQNIRFAGVKNIYGGSGTDVFTVNTDLDYEMQIFGGNGDDLFRFSGNSTGSAVFSGGDVAAPQKHVSAYGEGGSDRFNFYNQSDDVAVGGVGFDVIDYSQSTNKNHHVVNQTLGTVFSNDRIIGNSNAFNSVDVTLVGTSEVHWYIGGDWAVVRDASTMAQVELMNFDKYETSFSSHNKVWVLETTHDIEIFDAQWVQFGSRVDPAAASMDTIKHNVGLHRTPIYAPGSFLTPPIDSFPFSPEIVLTNQGGEGGTVLLHEDGSIRSGTSRIYFGPYTPESTNQRPNISIHGSGQSDYFVADRVWTNVNLYGQGGNDTFFVGGADEGSNLSLISSSIRIDGGDGYDQVYVNDQQNDNGPTEYRISDSEIEVGIPDSILTTDILFNDNLEFARVNGSATHQSYFYAVPSSTTTFIVDGVLQEFYEDTLTIEGQRDVRTISNLNGNGSWSFAGQRQPVYFYGVENPGETADPVGGALISIVDIPERSTAYDKIGNQVITSQAEMDAFIESLDDMNIYNVDYFKETFGNLDVHFEDSNFVIYQHTETSGSHRVNLGLPILRDGKVVIDVERAAYGPGSLGTADMAYRAFGYQVDKSIPELVFDVEARGRVEIPIG